MDNESIILLKLEEYQKGFLVSSPQFPLLNLALDNTSEEEITKCVLPVLKKMVEHEIGESVILRLVSAFQDRSTKDLQKHISPHVIASRLEAHVG